MWKSSYASVASTAPFDVVHALYPNPVHHHAYLLLGEACAGHTQSQDALVRWPKRQLYQARLRKGVVQKECKLGDMGKNHLWLTERKANIVLKGSRVFVQLEVQAAHQRDATVWKLSFGLIDQLRYLKNRGVDSNDVAGCYVPVVKGYVEKITGVWEAANLCYVISAQLLRQQEVFTTSRDVYVTQAACQLGQTISNFTLPLSQTFVHETWGDSADPLTSLSSWSHVRRKCSSTLLTGEKRAG